MLRKPLNNRSSRPEVFCKEKCSEKFRKNHRKKPALESLFWYSSSLRTATLLKGDSNTSVLQGNYAKFCLQNTSGGINKKRSEVHKQSLSLKIIYYYTTGWLPNEAFNLSLWNKTKNSSCSLNAEKTVFVSLEPKIVDYDFLHSKWF